MPTRTSIVGRAGTNSIRLVSSCTAMAHRHGNRHRRDRRPNVLGSPDGQHFYTPTPAAPPSGYTDHGRRDPSRTRYHRQPVIAATVDARDQFRRPFSSLYVQAAANGIVDHCFGIAGRWRASPLSLRQCPARLGGRRHRRQLPARGIAAGGQPDRRHPRLAFAVMIQFAPTRATAGRRAGRRRTRPVPAGTCPLGAATTADGVLAQLSTASTPKPAPTVGRRWH